MASPFRDDPYRRPDFGIDGGNPRILQAPARVGQHADSPDASEPARTMADASSTFAPTWPESLSRSVASTSATANSSAA
jgi:hypothetical protein